MIVGNAFTYTLKFTGREGLQLERENSYTLTGDTALENNGELRPATKLLPMEHYSCFYLKHSARLSSFGYGKRKMKA